MGNKPVVQIQRGQFSADFQIARAMLSAASASLYRNRKEAASYLDRAIKQLVELRVTITRQWPDTTDHREED